MGDKFVWNEFEQPSAGLWRRTGKSCVIAVASMAGVATDQLQFPSTLLFF